jgi:hypothetical protein
MILGHSVNSVESKMIGICIAVLVVFLQCFCPALSKTFPELVEEEEYTKQLLSGKTWQNAEPFLETMQAHIALLNDYVFESNQKCAKDDKLKVGSAKFFFKREQRIRLEVKSNGINNGAVVVRKEDGQIKACGGGMLKFVAMNLDPDSRMLQLPSGRNIIHADFASLVRDLLSQPKKGCQVKIANESIAGKHWSGLAKVIEVKDGGGIVTERVFINPGNSTPVEWHLYKDGELFSMTVFENFQANPGLKDSLFEM